jgi:hypothetical protein
MSPAPSTPPARDNSAGTLPVHNAPFELPRNALFDLPQGSREAKKNLWATWQLLCKIYSQRKLRNQNLVRQDGVIFEDASAAVPEAFAARIPAEALTTIINCFDPQNYLLHGVAATELDKQAKDLLYQLQADGRAAKWAAAAYCEGGSKYFGVDYEGDHRAFMHLEPPSKLKVEPTHEAGVLRLSWEYNPSAIDGHIVLGFIIFVREADKDAEWQRFNVKSRTLSSITKKGGDEDGQHDEQYLVNIFARSLDIAVPGDAKYEAMIFLGTHSSVERVASKYGITGSKSEHVQASSSRLSSASFRSGSSTRNAYNMTEYRCVLLNMSSLTPLTRSSPPPKFTLSFMRTSPSRH